MKRRHSLTYYIVIFVIVQIIWLSIAGLWISRFVINNVIHNKIGETYSVHVPDGGAVAMLVIGLSLLVLALVGMSLLFRYLNVQFNLTRLYDSFIANITHELKTPIASIQLYLDTLKKHTLDEEQRKKFINNIEKDTDKLTILINNILAVSRLEQKLQIYNCKIIDCCQLFQQYVDNFNEEHNISIKLNTLTQDLKIVFDEIALKHLLKNLVDNSIKYSLKKVEIIITLSQEKKWIKILYHDNGTGIQYSQRRKVFRKFYRGDHKNIPNVKGTGLGLFLVKEILKYHHGKIKILKPQNTLGTTFEILIPIYDGEKRYLKKLLGTK